MGWGWGHHRLLGFSFLFKMENARLLYLFQSTPQEFRPLTWELLGDRDQGPTFLSPQGRARHQPPEVLVGSVEAHQSFSAKTPCCPLSINYWASFQPSKNTSRSTTQNFGFSLCLKCFIIESKKKNSSATLQTQTR